MGFWEHQSEGGGGGQWLKVGRHTVKVEGYTAGKSPTKGTPFVEFTLVDKNGDRHKEQFYTTDAAMWRLVNFASACGMTKETHPDPGYKDFVGKYVVIDLVPQESNPKYCQIGAFMTREQAKVTKEPVVQVPADNGAGDGEWPF